MKVLHVKMSSKISLLQTEKNMVLMWKLTYTGEAENAFN